MGNVGFAAAVAADLRAGAPPAAQSAAAIGLCEPQARRSRVIRSGTASLLVVLMAMPAVPLARADKASPSPSTATGASAAGQRPSAPAAAAPAGSASPTAEELDVAKRHFDSGRLFYDKGNYAAARAEFEAAYQLSHYPVLLYNLANTAEKQGENALAVRYYESYLESNPDDADAVRARLAVLKPTVASSPEAPTSTQPPERLPPKPALALLGAGAGLLIIGIGLGGGAIAAANRVSDPANSNMPFAGDPETAERRGNQLSAAAITFDILGGVALGVGAAWTGYWLYQRKKAGSVTAPPGAARSPQTSSTSVVPLGLGLGVLHRF